MRRMRALAGLLLGAAALLLPMQARAEDNELWQVIDYEDGTYAVILKDKTLTEVEIPSQINGQTISKIEVDCFIDCENLKRVTIPDSITVIDDYAFYNCPSLEALTIPETVTKIGFMTFHGCSSLKEITIPAAVTEIEEFAFEGCSSLTGVQVAEGNQFYKDEDGILFDKEGTTLILYPSAKEDTSYTVPEGCTRVEDYAFIGNTFLQSVNIDNIEELGEDAFYYCTSLESITVPEAITELNGSVFGNCQSLVSVRLPDTLTSIGNSCFYNCFALPDIDIPDSVTSIGDYAFFNCPQLSEIRLTKNTASIGKFALGFYYEEGDEPTRMPGFQVDAEDNTAAFAYCVENSIKCTGGITQGTVFIYIILGVIAAVIVLTVLIVMMQKRIQKRYEI